MKLPINWLKSFVDTKLSAAEIADKLTMAGLEVEEILGGSSFSGVVVGHVLSVDNHPNADKLHVARVKVSSSVIPEKAGTQEGMDSLAATRNDDGILQIVCGAPNLEKGQNVPVALVGARLDGYEISKATLRGVDSYGMICSERELGISENHDGIMVLPADLEPGTDVSTILGGEQILDVKVLANRPDCMSVIGLANEVAVVTDSHINIPAIKFTEANEKIDFTVKVEDDKLCPRYVARFVTGLVQAETPAWMRERLIVCGVRPISLMVDISNYVMLEYGQPLHFFDLDKLKDKTIIVRPAKDKEEIVTLDGVSRKLTKDNLVIANSKQAVAVAGVMGGSETEIDENTKSILIEAAVFDKASIRRTSRALGLRSEAVARFEKGISLMLPEVAINRAAELLAELGKGCVSKTVIDIYKKAEKSKVISISMAKLNSFLGTEITENEAETVLTALGFKLEKKNGTYSVIAPFWRTDIAEEVDIYEEVIRIIGYDRVPYTLPFCVGAVPETNQYVKYAAKSRDRLSSIGFDEILTYSFIGVKELAAVGVSTTAAPEVQNPLVSDQQYLRPTLVPKMLEAIRDNQFNREILRFFEIGKSFEKLGEGKLPKETNWLTLGLTTDYYDAKGAVCNLLAGFGILEDEIVIKQTTADFLKKGIGADLFVQGKKIASLGEIRKAVREKFDIKRSVVVALINIDTLLELNLPEVKFAKFSKYQQVVRDLSAVFDREITVAKIRQKLALASKLVTKIEIIDIYQDKKLNQNERSITIRFYFQSEDSTLTENEVDEALKVVNNKIIELGGKLRGGS